MRVSVMGLPLSAHRQMTEEGHQDRLTASVLFITFSLLSIRGNVPLDKAVLCVTFNTHTHTHRLLFPSGNVVFLRRN